MSGGPTLLSRAPRLALALLVALGLGDAARAQGDATDPESCREFWEGIGLPATRKDFRCDETACDFVTVCHEGYITLHNNVTKTPDWVIQHMTAAQVSGDEQRPDVDFKPEQHAPGDRRAIDDDYKNSGLARGHQAASADYSMDPALMEDTFFFSNAVPQVGSGFNSGIWSALEGLVRDLARERGEIFVITGPIYQDQGGQERVIEAEDNPCRSEIRLPPLAKTSICDANDDDDDARCANGVAVPSALYKIIYDPGNQRVNAYVLPNLNHTPLKQSMKTREYLNRHRASVALVEEYTGFDFLTALSRRDQSVIEESCPATFFH